MDTDVGDPTELPRPKRSPGLDRMAPRREAGVDRDRDARRRRTGHRGAPPWPVVLVAVVAAGFLLLPFVGLVQRTPWSRIGDLLGRDVVADALRLSLTTATLAAVVCLVLGVPLAWLLARSRFPGHSLLRAFVVLPMVLPPVVGGAALLFAFGRRGLFGQVLDEQLGVVLPYSTAGVVVAEAFVAMPFLVVTVEGALRSVDGRHEEAAATLGAGRWSTFLRVTAPAIRPSLMAGAVLCWARAFGEFGATLTFAGNLQGRTQTMPLAVAEALENDRQAALALALVQVAVALAVLVSLRHHWWPTHADRPAMPRSNGRHSSEPEAMPDAGRRPSPRPVPDVRHRLGPDGDGRGDAQDGPRLEARVVTRLGDFELDLEVDVSAGEVLAVVGPNGTGKTTLLRALAGLIPLDAASHVALGHQVLDAPAAGTHIPAEHRRVGVVFQDLRLFDNLTALDNVAFGLRRQGVHRDEARRRAHAWLTRLDLAAHAHAHPSRLSRGQAQRVALARALATDPQLLLLDEPLAAVDTAAKSQVRAELAAHLATVAIPTLFVTHDPTDTDMLAHRTLPLPAGRLAPPPTTT